MSENVATSAFAQHLPALIIFDCDGVLVDSERLNVEIESEMITAAGWSITPTEVARTFLGTTDDHMFEEIERHIGHALTDEWKSSLHKSYAARFAESLQAVPGITEVLDELEVLGVPVCVATNGTSQKMTRSLTKTNLFDRFTDRCFSAELVERGKPEPDLFFFAAAAMGAAPETCVVVEDSPSGIRAARAAGMHVLAYASDFVSDDMIPFDDVTVFRSMSELPSLITNVVEREG